MKLTCDGVSRFKSVFLFYTIMKNEIWKDVVGYETIYEVSNMGNVRRKEGSKYYRGLLLKLSPAKDGYCLVKLCNGKTQVSYLAHRLVAIAFLENPESKREVNHKNGIKMDNRIDNLEWATPTENQMHAIKNGLKTFKTISGDKQYNSKLSQESVEYIKSNFVKGKTPLKYFAEKFGVHVTTICKITANKNWRWLK